MNCYIICFLLEDSGLIQVYYKLNISSDALKLISSNITLLQFVRDSELDFMLELNFDNIAKYM